MNSQPSFNDMTTLVSQASLTASTSIGSASSTQTFYYGVPTASNSSMDLLEDDDELFVNPTVEDFMTMDTTKTYIHGVTFCILSLVNLRDKLVKASYLTLLLC